MSDQEASGRTTELSYDSTPLRNGADADRLGRGQLDWGPWGWIQTSLVYLTITLVVWVRDPLDRPIQGPPEVALYFGCLSLLVESLQKVLKGPVIFSSRVSEIVKELVLQFVEHQLGAELALQSALPVDNRRGLILSSPSPSQLATARAVRGSRTIQHQVLPSWSPRNYLRKEKAERVRSRRESL